MSPGGVQERGCIWKLQRERGGLRAAGEKETQKVWRDLRPVGYRGEGRPKSCEGDWILQGLSEKWGLKGRE